MTQYVPTKTWKYQIIFLKLLHQSSKIWFALVPQKLLFENFKVAEHFDVGADEDTNILIQSGATKTKISQHPTCAFGDNKYLKDNRY